MPTCSPFANLSSQALTLKQPAFTQRVPSFSIPPSLGRPNANNGSSPNWPHIIEANHIDTALAAGEFGPDTDRLANEIIRTTNNPTLHQAAREREPWLAAALNQTSHPKATTISERSLGWLEKIADYRHNHGLTSRDPLGSLPHNPEQRTRWNDLVDQANNLHQPQPEAAPPLSYAINPNEYLLHQLDTLGRTDPGRPGPDLGIER